MGARLQLAVRQAWRSCGLVLVLSLSTAAAAATTAAQSPDPVEWVWTHWAELLAAGVAYWLMHYVKRIDTKFDSLFAWKDTVDGVVGVHKQVWDHGDGCGPLWVHHRADGESAVHFRGTDHPGVCEKCKGLQGVVIPTPG